MIAPSFERYIAIGIVMSTCLHYQTRKQTWPNTNQRVIQLNKTSDGGMMELSTTEVFNNLSQLLWHERMKSLCLLIIAPMTTCWTLKWFGQSVSTNAETTADRRAFFTQLMNGRLVSDVTVRPVIRGVRIPLSPQFCSARYKVEKVIENAHL